MSFRTALSRRLGIHTPIFVAPMAGGPTTPELVVAACSAGALGSLGGAYLSPANLRNQIQRIRAQTPWPFAVNLFLPAAPLPPELISPARIEAATAATRPYRAELGLPDPPLIPPFHEDFDKQFAVVLEEAPAALSFVFGTLDAPRLEACRTRGICTIGAATNLDEGLALQRSGVDAIVAQGVEAGGHRAVFSADLSTDDDPCIRTRDLTRTLVQHLSIPVIAAGGIVTGAGIDEMLRLGAQAVQLGTAFLIASEAGTSAAYRSALRGEALRTGLTRAFSGRVARGAINRFMSEMAAKEAAVLPFPAQNAFTRDIRNEATRRGRPEFLSLWAGEGVGSIRADSTEGIMRVLLRELEEAGGSVPGVSKPDA